MQKTLKTFVNEMVQVLFPLNIPKEHDPNEHQLDEIWSTTIPYYTL